MTANVSTFLRMKMNDENKGENEKNIEGMIMNLRIYIENEEERESDEDIERMITILRREIDQEDEKGNDKEIKIMTLISRIGNAMNIISRKLRMKITETKERESNGTKMRLMKMWNQKKKFSKSD